MKKLICALLSIFVITPCLANIHINSTAVTDAIAKHFPDPDARNAAHAEYNAQIKNAGGEHAGIPASGVWQVCKAAGLDITKHDGESKCRAFGDELIKNAHWKFRAVCGKDNFMVARGTGRCIDDVFSNKVIGGIKVNKLIANGLAKEYARIKYKDENLVCSQSVRKTTVPPDDYIQCISMDKNMAYEFKFDSVTATNDAEINASTEAGVCKIFDLKYSPLGVTLDTAYSKGESWPAACEATDTKICSKINESLKRFGRSAKIGTTGSKSNKHSACIIQTDGITPTTLRTAFGIDNYVFKKNGVQLNASVAVKKQVCDYVRNNVKTTKITSCDCDDGFVSLYDYSGIITQTDDVLTCRINGQPVDFVFDDLSEEKPWEHQAGLSKMACAIIGGRGDDRNCRGLEEPECEKLNDALVKRGSAGAHYDVKLGGCILDDAQKAHNINLGLQIAGGIALTAVTAGAASSPVVVLLGASVATDIAFELVEDWQRRIPYSDYKKFINAADECGDISTADSLGVDKYCVLNVLNDNYALLIGELSDLAPDVQVEAITKLSQMADIVGDENIVQKIPPEKRVRNYVQAGLFGGMFLFHPEKALGKINKADDFVRLATKASKNFGKHFDDFVRTGLSNGLPVGRLSDSEWRKLNELLKNKGVELYDDVMKGINVKRFGRIGDSLLHEFGAVLREGSSSFGGRSYYRIFVNSDTDVKNIVKRLQSNGFYISSGVTVDGERFIAASRENIFGVWDNVPNNWLKFGVNTGIANNIDDLVRKYNKRLVLRSGASNSLGRDYYRIIIDDNDDVRALIDDLRRNGFFVSANQTKDGVKFIGASKDNIFQPWENAPTNWLKGYSGGSVRGRGIFDKIYNDMPNDVLKRKLDYIYSVINRGGSNMDVVEAMKHVGAFDEYKAGLLAQDIADETINRISRNPDLVAAGKKWKRLSDSEKRQFVAEVHDLVTQERRTRAGNTIIGFGDNKDGAWGWHRRPWANNSREFSYNIDKFKNAEDALGTIIHENVHSFQTVNKSSIPEQLERLSRQYYVTAKDNFDGYWNALIEVEARYVAEHSTPQIVRALGW